MEDIPTELLVAIQGDLKADHDSHLEALAHAIRRFVTIVIELELANRSKKNV